MTTDQARQPKGSPDGGEFAAVGGAESGVTLLVMDHDDVARALDTGTLTATAPAGDWGEVNLHWGSRTPWGEAQQVEQVAPGIARIGTASHGGFKLSAQRNREVPAPLRREGGWYEEDCEFHTVLRTFPEVDEFHRGGMTTDEVREFGDRGVREYFGRQWAEATGNPVPEATLEQERKDSESTAAREAEMSARPDAERFVVTEIPMTGASAAQKSQANKDLDKLWRWEDGSVKSLRQILATEGVAGREKRYADGKTRYALMLQDKQGGPKSVIKVSKATFEALETHVPDTLDPRSRAYDAQHLAKDKLRDIELSLRSATYQATRGNSSAAADKKVRQLEARKSLLTADVERATSALEEMKNGH